MHWYFEVLKKYAVFSGRACRAEYWMFFLINIVIYFVLLMLTAVLPGDILQGALMLLYFVYGLAVLLPGIGVFVRRLHDTGRSGWWWLIGLVPILGAILLIVFMVQEGNPEENQYGPPPTA